MTEKDLIKLDIEEGAGQYVAYLDDMRISKAKPVGIMHNIHSINCRKDYIKEALGIPEGSVVLTNAEWARLRNLEINYDDVYETYRKYDIENQQLKKQVRELEEQRDRQAYIAEDLIQSKHRWTEQTRKETAKEILKALTTVIHDNTKYGGNFVVLYLNDLQELAKQFGVEVE